MERYGDEEQRSSMRHTAATRRDGSPCGAGLRSASSATLSVGSTSSARLALRRNRSRRGHAPF